MKKLIPVMVFVFCWLSLVWADGVVNRIVAVVNGEVVTLHDLEKNLEMGLKGAGAKQTLGAGEQRKALEKALLDSMVDSILIRQEAKRLKIEVTPADVQARIKQLEDEQGLTHEEFVVVLKKRGMDFEEFKAKLRNKILENRMLRIMVRDKVVVTDEEIQDYFKRHKAKFKISKTVHLKLLSLPDRKGLEAARQALESGQTELSQLGQKDQLHSSRPSSGAEFQSRVQVNDLGILNWKDLRPQWQELLAGLHSGQMSQIFPLGDQYAVLYVQELDSKGKSALDKVKDRIYKKLYARKLEQRYKQYINQLRSKAVLQIKL